ncbi:lyase family protein [Nocardioides pakistanensis]
MSSPAERDLDPADLGLLSPVSAGTAAETLTGDAAVADALVRAEAALLRALAATGIAPPVARDAAEVVGATDIDVRELAVAAVRGGNPVIPLVAQLRNAVATGIGGEATRWVHFGATSQDILDTALMLVAARVGDRVEQDLTGLAHHLARFADENRAVPIVARTLTQQAMPTTLGFRAAGWLAGVDDAVRTLRAARALPVSLGGPVGSAAAYGERGAELVEAFARELGLGSPVTSWHTRRTPVVELVHAHTGAASACSKIAADVLVMCQTEVAEASEGAGGPSSAMAHKSNPAQSVLVVAAARQLPALASVVAASATAEQERPAGAWHAEWQMLRTVLRTAGGAVERTAELVPAVHWDRYAMARNLDRLVDILAKDHAWVQQQTAHVDLWVDRVLREHEELFA